VEDNLKKLGNVKNPNESPEIVTCHQYAAGDIVVLVICVIDRENI
jgi:hypothetical protein